MHPDIICSPEVESRADTSSCAGSRHREALRVGRLQICRRTPSPDPPQCVGRRHCTQAEGIVSDFTHFTLLGLLKLDDVGSPAQRDASSVLAPTPPLACLTPPLD